MSTQTRAGERSSHHGNRNYPAHLGSDTQVQPERWLVAARLSRMSKKDRMRGDAAITGIHTQDKHSTAWVIGEAGGTVVDVTKDRNVSGAMPPWERPELGPWLTDPAKIIQYDGIVAYDVSRVSRDYADLAWLRKWAEKNHKKLYVVKERLRWPDNRDGILWGVAAERVYEERQEIIERVTRELNALRDAGKLVGRPPFGYKTAGKKWDRRLKPTKTGRKYIPLIFRHFTEGWSLEQIASWLIAEGVKSTSGVWLPRTISTIIKNPTYRGHRCERVIIPPDTLEEKDGKIIRYRYGSQWRDTPRWEYGKTIHRCEALVDATTWKLANDSFGSRPKRGYSNPENRAMLSGALHCGICADSPMYRWTNDYYRCNGRGSRRESCGNMVRLDVVDNAVNDIIQRTFNTKVIEYRIVKGNRAELANRLDEIKFELRQLAAAGLDWAEEDARRAELRAEYERVNTAEEIFDRIEEAEADHTYAELWNQLQTADRGAWLVKEGFRITASKEQVSVSRKDTQGILMLPEQLRQRTTVVQTGSVLQGKCLCGCGNDVYGSKDGRRKLYLSRGHAKAYKQGRTAKTTAAV